MARSLARIDRRLLLAGGVGLAFASGKTMAAEPGRTDAQMKDDWPWLGRYAAENRAIRVADTKVRIAFMGDSITEGWVKSRPNFFQMGWIGRGISGQTTPQMLLRMMADIVSHRPKLVHILGGTNDVAENTGPITPRQTIANVQMMISIAQQAGIGVLLGAIPPAADFWWRRGMRPATKIQKLNEMLEALARETRSNWIDYHRALSDGKGGMHPDFSDDGVHPNLAGYAAMEDLAEPVIKRATKSARPREC